MCPSFAQALDKNCNVNDDCTKITCSERFVEKDITFSFDINKCADPVTVTTKMKVPDLGIYWTHTYTSGDIVAVPGFTVNLPLVSGGVYVQVTLDSSTSKLQIKVRYTSRPKQTARKIIKSCQNFTKTKALATKNFKVITLIFQCVIHIKTVQKQAKFMCQINIVCQLL